MSGSAGGFGVVGAAFVIEDQATAILDRIQIALGRTETAMDAMTVAAEDFSKIRFGGITRSLGGVSDALDRAAAAGDRLSQVRFAGTTNSVRALDRAITDVDASVTALPTTFDSSMNRIASHIGLADAEMRRFEGTMNRVTAGAAALGNRLAPALGAMQGGGGGGRGGRGGGGSGGGGGRSGGVHGRVHASPSGVGMGAAMGGGGATLGALGLGFLAYEAVKGGAEYDQALRNATMNLGQDPDSPEGQQILSILDETTRTATVGTRFSSREAAPALADFYGVVGSGLSGTPIHKAQQFQGLTTQGLRFSEAEVAAGHGDLRTNMQSFAEFSHLLRSYDPKEMSDVADKLLAMSRMTGKDPLEIERITKYAVSTGGLAKVDMNEILSLVGFAMQSGMTGTTAGTGLAAVLQQVMKGEAPDQAQAGRAHRELQQRHLFEQAMRGETGVGREIHERAKKEPASRLALEKLGILDPKTHQLFPQYLNERGGIREDQVLIDMAKRSDQMPGHSGGVLVEQALGQRGARQVAPFMEEGGKIFQQYLETQKKLIEAMNVETTNRVNAAGAMGEFLQLKSRISDFGTALVTTDGALTGLGAVAKMAADAIAGWTTWLRTSKEGPPVQLPDDIIRRLGPKYIPSNRDEMWHQELLPAPMPEGASPGTPHPGFRSTPGTDEDVRQHSSYHGGAPSVTIQNVNFGPGTPREHADQFAQELSRMLNRSQQNDLGGGWGYSSSGFTSGRGVSV